MQYSTIRLAIPFPGLEEREVERHFPPSPPQWGFPLDLFLAHLGMAPESSLEKVTGVNGGPIGAWMILELQRG